MEESLQQFFRLLKNQSLPREVFMEVDYISKQLEANPLLLTGDVQIILKHLESNAESFFTPEAQKCTIRAAALRQEGNRLFERQQFLKSLEKYNESICMAPNDSANLGIGYANRSAVYYEMKMYGLAIANIELALKHHYPQHLKPNLYDREFNCRLKHDKTDFSWNRSEYVTLIGIFDVVPKPSLTHLAKGIVNQELPTGDRAMVAEKDFAAGECILQESPLIGSVGWDKRFTRCNFCFSANLLNLIPCSSCTSVMFCNELCMKAGQRQHRFECGSSTNMSRFYEKWIGPRLFFHGLSLFECDFGKMMTFCRENRGSGTLFSTLDYSKYDPKEEFRMFLRTRVEHPSYERLGSTIQNFFAVLFFKMYLNVPLVRSLVANKAQENFMLQCFLDFMHITQRLFVSRSHEGFLYPVASDFGQSCDPNAIVLGSGRYMQMIVLRPIRRGDQIVISYDGKLCYQRRVDFNCRLLTLKLTCSCIVCNESAGQQLWWEKYKQPCSIDRDCLLAMQRIASNEDLPRVERINAMQQFVQKHGSNHPQKDFAKVVERYRDELVDSFRFLSMVTDYCYATADY